MSTTLIIGVDGIIGQALAEALSVQGQSVIGTTRRRTSSGAGERLHLDLTDPAIGSVKLPDAETMVICAAMSRYKDCSEQPDLARQVNVTAPTILARQFISKGGHAVLLSTSAVFDCRSPQMNAKAPTTPASSYGKFKAQAEYQLLKLGQNASVLRLTKVLHSQMPLLTGWIEILKQGRPVNAFCDLTISPLTLADVTTALLGVLDDRGGGIYQVSGKDDINYADIARCLAYRLGVNPTLVNETLATDNNIAKEDIALFTSLDTTRLNNLLGWEPPKLGDVLDSVLDGL